MKSHEDHRLGRQFHRTAEKLFTRLVGVGDRPVAVDGNEPIAHTIANRPSLSFGIPADREGTPDAGKGERIGSVETLKC